MLPGRADGLQLALVQRWLCPLGRGLEIPDPGLLSHPAEFSAGSSHCPVLELVFCSHLCVLRVRDSKLEGLTRCWGTDTWQLVAEEWGRV